MKMTLKDPLGLIVLSLLLPSVLLGLLVGCTFHQPTAGLRQGLQGTWEGYRCGKGPTIEHTITFTGNSLRYQGTNSSDWYDAAFTLPAQTNPQQMRATITGGFETNFNGQVVRCIIKIEDGTLTLASACGGLDEDPPKSFTDKEYPNYWCYELRKVQPQKTKAEASTSK